MKDVKVLMVLRTRGLEYDDRVRKECTSLARNGLNVRVLVVETRNEVGERNMWGGVMVRSWALWTRRFLPQRRGLVLKLFEFSVGSLAGVLRIRPDVVWAHNQESAAVVAGALMLRRLGVVNRVVWDQHELPDRRVMGSRVLRWGWKRLMQGCDAVVVANGERRAFLHEHVLGHETIAFAVVENRADRKFQELPQTPLPKNLRVWARGRPYILLQGGGHPGRHLEEVVTAIVAHVDAEIGIVVVGGRQSSVESSLRTRWGDAFDDHVFFTGWIPQFEIANLIDHSIGSLILYSSNSPNSWYCAPNRLYQAISRGKAVIVGANPPMAALVSQRNLGVVLDGSGTSPDDIARGVTRLLNDPTQYREAIIEARDSLLWENQEVEISWVCDGCASNATTGVLNSVRT